MEQTKQVATKPICKLTETDGNVFALIGAVSRTLKKAGLIGQAKEFEDRAFQCGSYDETLRLMMRYVDVE